MRQCYKDAVNHFRQNPGDLYDAWMTPFRHPHGCLFKFCSPDGHTTKIPGVGWVGCPLQVGVLTTGFMQPYVAFTPTLTEKVRAMNFPSRPTELQDEHLVALARLQDEMDDTIRREEWLKEHRYAIYPSDTAGHGASESLTEEADDGD